MLCGWIEVACNFTGRITSINSSKIQKQSHRAEGNMFTGSCAWAEAKNMVVVA